MIEPMQIRVAIRTIIDLLAEDGIQVHHASGDEFHSPCPQCGGRDRFSSFPNRSNQDGRYMGGRFICRRCHFHGDAATYLMEKRGLSFLKACSDLGLDPDTKPAVHLSVVKSASWHPADPKIAPNEAWQAQAEQFSKASQKALQANQTAFAWLKEKRGLNAETVKSAGLGINVKDQWLSRAAWGLSEETNQKTGKLKKVWLPAGLVIPSFDEDGKVIRLRIRRNHRGEGQRYVVASGSIMAPMVFWGNQTAVVIVESELDAILIAQEAGDLVAVVAMGSAQAKPGEGLHKRLSAAQRVFVALDADDAGGKAAWTFWKSYPGFKRWPCVKGKDPNEQRLDGIPVRDWIEAALISEPAVKVDLTTSKDPQTGTVSGNYDLPPSCFTEATIYQGQPDQAAIDLADEMMKFIAELGRPATEDEITGGAGGDPRIVGAILRRLVLGGIADLQAPGLYSIPPWPPRPADLPEKCPLKTGGATPDGCAFDSQMLKRMVTTGALPLPRGSCPLRALCGVGSEK